jgi:hypothetical protein
MERGAICWSIKLTTKPTKPSKPTEVLYRLLLVVVIWRKSKKTNVDEVDSDSKIDEAMTDTPPDIADEASAAKQD